MITHAVTTVLILVISITGMISPTALDYTRGVLVVDYGVPMFTLNGVMFGGYSKHEYGHHLQQNDMGDEEYYAAVAVPSVIGNIIWATSAYIFDDPICMVKEYQTYFPWEADATRRAKELQ